MIEIRKAKREDVRIIQDVFYKTWLATYPNEKIGITKEDIEERFKKRLSKEAIQKRIEHICDMSGNYLFLVATNGDSVIGVCRLEKTADYFQIMAIYVLPEYQRNGIGKMFWEEAKKYFRKEKDIIVQVAIYNTKAISFYQKLGFTDTGKRFTEENLRMPLNGVAIPEMEMIIKLDKLNTE